MNCGFFLKDGEKHELFVEDSEAIIVETSILKLLGYKMKLTVHQISG